MKSLIFTLLTFSLIQSISWAQTTWTGSFDNDFGNDANWTNNKPDDSTNPGTIGGGTPLITANFNAIVTQNAGTVSLDTTGFVRINNASSYNLLGGVFDISNTGRLDMSGTSTFTVDGGSFTQSGGTGSAVQMNTSDNEFSVLSGSMNLTGGSIAHRDGLVLIDNSTMTVGEYQFKINSAAEPGLTLQNGATLITTAGNGFNYNASNVSWANLGQISFEGTASSIQANTWNRPANFNFDFATSSSGSFIQINTGFYDATAWEAQWTSGNLTVAGGNSGSFGDHFTVSGDTLTYIPEPSTFLLMFSSLILLGFARRKH